MIVLDASVVIAFLQPSDRHHTRAITLLEEHVADAVLMHPINLAEVLVGAERHGRGSDLLRDLVAIGIQQAPHTDPLHLARLRVATGLKLPDCCALAAALDANGALATFDDALAAAARERHLPVQPV